MGIILLELQNNIRQIKIKIEYHCVKLTPLTQINISKEVCMPCRLEHSWIPFSSDCNNILLTYYKRSRKRHISIYIYRRILEIIDADYIRELICVYCTFYFCNLVYTEATCSSTELNTINLNIFRRQQIQNITPTLHIHQLKHLSYLTKHIRTLTIPVEFLCVSVESQQYLAYKRIFWKYRTF